MNRTTSLVLLVVLFGSARLWRGIARNNPVMPGFGIGASRNASATPKAYHLRGPVAGPVRTEHDEYPHLFGSAPAIPARRGHRDGGVGGAPLGGSPPTLSPVRPAARRAAIRLADALALSLWRRLTPRQRSAPTLRCILLTPAARAANADA